MEKKGRMTGILGIGRRVKTNRLLTSRQITRDEAVKMVGDEILDKFDRKLEEASGRLQRISICEYSAQAGKAFVKIELANSLVYQDTYELSDAGLRVLKVRINYAADDVHHDGNDEFDP